MFESIIRPVRAALADREFRAARHALCERASFDNMERFAIANGRRNRARADGALLYGYADSPMLSRRHVGAR